MVNYCCVFGCGRNSRENNQLNYYCLPKERERQVEWLRAVHREDLLNTNKLSVSYRFCSRHFPLTSLKNRYLSPDAVPTLNLPGATNEDVTCDVEPMSHTGIACNNCREEIKGFRYKCVTCKDYDLCTKCEMREHHDHHFMLRIPRPLKFRDADNLLKKWRSLVNTDNINMPNYDYANEPSVKTEPIFEDSSDDEPITKYLSDKKRNASLLSEDVKRKIRAEVLRVFKLRKAKNSSNEKSACNNKGVTNGMIKTKRKRTQAPERCSKRVRRDGDHSLDSGKGNNTVEVAFADVNDFGNNEIANEVKIEVNDET